MVLFALVPALPASTWVRSLKRTRTCCNQHVVSASQGWNDQSGPSALADEDRYFSRSLRSSGPAPGSYEAAGNIASFRDSMSAAAGGHDSMDSMHDLADVVQRGGEVHVNGGELPLLLAELQMQRARERLQELRDLYLEVSKEIAHDPLTLQQTAAEFAKRKLPAQEQGLEGAGPRQVNTASLAWDVMSIVLAPLAPLAPGILRQVKKDDKYDPWAALAAFIEPTGKYYKYCMFGDVMKSVREHEAAPAKSDEDPWGWMMTRMLGSDTHSKYDPLDSRPLQNLDPSPAAEGSWAAERLHSQADHHHTHASQHLSYDLSQQHAGQQGEEVPQAEQQYWRSEGWAVQSAELVSSGKVALAEERWQDQQARERMEERAEDRWHSSLPPVDREIFRFN